MNIYKISQKSNNDYDTYDSAIVAAENEEMARKTHPNEDCRFDGFGNAWYDCSNKYSSTWAFKLEDVAVELIGVAKEKTEAGVILASFNAG